MNADDLAADQCRKMRETLFPLANYVIRLRKRMERRGFPPGDPLYRLVAQTQENLQALTMELHYRSVGTGVGRPEKGQKISPREEIDARRSRGENSASSTET